jgi:predicted small secreted protein
MSRMDRHRRITVLTWVMLILVGAGSLSACNTIEGAGQDVERAGEAVQDAIQ